MRSLYSSSSSSSSSEDEVCDPNPLITVTNSIDVIFVQDAVDDRRRRNRRLRSFSFSSSQSSSGSDTETISGAESISEDSLPSSPRSRRSPKTSQTELDLEVRTIKKA